MVRSHLGDVNLLPEEIIRASRSAAEVAVKAAEAARALAVEKAAAATKAISAAKNALDMVANLSEDSPCKEIFSRKNKLKKNVQVDMLYNNNMSNISNNKNGNTDEELARNLHRVMNSSPRIIKNSSSPDLNSHNKHKRLKTSNSEKTRVSNGFVVYEGKSLFTSNVAAGEVDSEGSVVRVEGSTSKFDKDQEKKDEITIQTNKRTDEAVEESSAGRKRGRIKQKKLPLSICNFRDQSNPKEDHSTDDEIRPSRRLLSEEKISSNKPSDESVMTSSSTWKCQSLKAQTACVKQNKVLQS
jgi:hypothetical protein